MVVITARDNKTVKLVRSLQAKKARMENRLYFAEGRRIALEAITYKKEQVFAVLVSESFAEKNSDLINGLDIDEKILYCIQDKVFADICDTETPQGIGVVLRIEDNTMSFDGGEFLLALDGVAEPGNLGTIVRTAEAAGVDGIILLSGCADIYNPKVVRSTMGSLFRMPHICGASPELLKEYKEKGFFITATALTDSVSIKEAKVAKKRLLVIGSEANGISDEVLEIADQKIRIDMEGQVESLNAAVAAGIAMYALKGI